MPKLTFMMSCVKKAGHTMQAIHLYEEKCCSSNTSKYRKALLM